MLTQNRVKTLTGKGINLRLYQTGVQRGLDNGGAWHGLGSYGGLCYSGDMGASPALQEAGR